MNKNAALAFVATTFLAFPVVASGVASIQEDGRSASGQTMYRIACSSGTTWRIYWSNGQWYSGGLGAQGGQSRSLSEQAEFLCR